MERVLSMARPNSDNYFQFCASFCQFSNVKQIKLFCLKLFVSLDAVNSWK